MIWTSLLLCAALGAGDPAREAGELRVHDLHALLVPYRNELALQLAPCREAGGPAEGESDRLDVGLVVELLRSLCAPEFEYEGRVLREAEERLYVVAPAAVQEKVAHILDFLAGTLGAQIELVLDEAVLAEPLAKDPPQLLALDEAQRLQAGAVQRHSFTLGVRPGWIGTAGNVRATSILSTWNVEIAQAAAIHDPQVDVVPAGQRFACAAANAPGGTWLALVARSAESGGPKDHALEFSASVAAESGSVPNPGGGAPITRTSGRLLQPGPKVWQSLPLGLHAAVVNTFLPEGKVLCLASTIGAGEERGTHLLFVRRAGKPVAAAQGFSLDGKQPGRDLVLVDAGWLTPPCAGTEGDLRAGGALPMFESELGPLVARLRVPEAGFAHELVGGSEGLDVFDSRSWLVLARSQRAAEGAGVEATLARLARSAPEAQSLGATLTLRRGPNVLARGTLALRAGCASTLVAGAEDEQLRDWDVEVAQGCAAAVPMIHPSFEGLCARVRAGRDAGGTLRLEVEAFGQARAGEARNLEPQVPTVGAITLCAWDRLRVDERVALPAEGARRASFGDGAGQGLALEIELAELR